MSAVPKSEVVPDLGELSDSTRQAIALADLVRNRLHKNEVSLDHLLYALYQKPDGVNRKALEEHLGSPSNLASTLHLGTLNPQELPTTWQEVPLANEMPPLDGDVVEALKHAAKLRAEDTSTDSTKIALRHVVDAALWLRKGAVVLPAKGIELPKLPAPVTLMQVGSTTIEAQVTATPWHLAVDAFTLPTGPRLKGGLMAEALEHSLHSKGWELLTSAVNQARGSTPQFSADSPLVVEVPDSLKDEITPRRMFVATASGARSHAQAILAVARSAAKLSLKSVAIPMIGAGAGGSSFIDTVHDVLLTLSRTGGFEGLTTVRLVDVDPGSLAVFQDTARKVAFTPPERASYDNDDVLDKVKPDDDCLDVQNEAARFARLLTAKDVKPPLSIGLFGNWGTGKTFFMKLMKEQINALCDKGGETDSPYHANIAQIDFNAWHYIDTNLWASLAMRIFDGLAQELQSETQTDVEAIRQRLQASLTSNKRARSRAEHRQKEANTIRSMAVLQLAGLQPMRDQTWQALSKRVFSRLTKDEGIRKQLDELGRIANEFGLSPLLESAADVKRVVRELRNLEGVGRTLGAAIVGRFSTLGRGLTSSLVLLAVPVLSILLESGIRALKQQPLFSWLENLSPILLEIGVVVSAASTWMSQQVSARSQELGRAEALLAKVEAGNFEPDTKPANEEEKLRRAEEQMLRKELERVEAEIQKRTEEISEAERHIAEAEAELQRINNGGLVYDFLQERIRNPRYAEQLGLISMIRHDLQHLGTLLDDLNKNGNGTRKIDRIVLYIDDLDRCHPDKVVEVLQAIHLLLAFNLFSVVVGVDPRWLERSLHRAYVGDKDLGPQDAIDPRKQAPVFNPQNYLEKIFQIPFTLRPMSAGGFSKLVNQLVINRTEAAKTTDQNTIVAVIPHALVNPPPSIGALENEAPTSPPQKPPLINNQGPEVLARAKKGDVLSQALFLEDWEEAYLQGFGDIIPTPRIAKRFVNVYRLLRVQSVEDGDRGFEQFVGDSEGRGHHRAAILLLAVNLGFPAVGGILLQSLIRRPSMTTWTEFLKQFESGAQAPHLKQEIARVSNLLKMLKSKMVEDLAPYIQWASRVERYSFQWNSPLPDDYDGPSNPGASPR